MRLDPIELTRLALMQNSPADHVERRVENLELVDDYHYAVTVTQQMTIPSLRRAESIPPAHGNGQDTAAGSADGGDTPAESGDGGEAAADAAEGEASAPRVPREGDPSPEATRLVPLGWFPKIRLPDIRVADGSGSALPVLTREDQGRAAAFIFSAAWEERVFEDFPLALANDDAKAIWAIVQTSVVRVVIEAPEDALLVVYRLRRFLTGRRKQQGISTELKCFLLTLLDNGPLWDTLEGLARSRLLIARMPAAIGETHVITVRYTERFNYRPLRPKSLWRGALSLGRRLLSRLGVIGIAVTRQASNIGQAASLWVIFSAPDGLEPVRCFWESEVKDAGREDISVDTEKAALGKHVGPGADPASDGTVLDLQVAVSTALVSSILLATLLALVGFYMYKASQTIAKEAGEQRTILIGLATVFAAAPAAILGALAYRGKNLERIASSGPRVLLWLLTVQAALLAVAVGLHGPGDLTEVLGFILYVSSLIVVGVFTLIRFGPRWRRNERSRRPRLTSTTAPADCRRKQRRFALVALLAWLGLVWVLARAGVALRDQHILSSPGFPDDVRRALEVSVGL
jgi:hypothetical protein